MGGQYEPHFDFSRVSPQSLVVLKGSALAGLTRLELLEAFQLSRHPSSAFHLIRGKTMLLVKHLQGLVKPGCFLSM